MLSGTLGSGDVPLLIEWNGNHWRKIFTIMAKLVCPDDWRNYRDHELLQQNEVIRFEMPKVRNDRVIYFYCGKQIADRVHDKEEFVPLIPEGSSVLVKENAIICPYLDYRQFSNQTIADILMYLRRLGGKHAGSVQESI